MEEQSLTIDGGTGPRLEGRLSVGPGARAGLVVCHPHPLYGGDMDNPVVVRAVDVAAEAGIATLRFNFRGVGTSEGSHGGGAGEQDDVRTALAALRAHLPGDGPLGLAGYSFGAGVSSRVALGGSGLAALALIGPPLGMFDFGDLGGLSLDLLLLAGTRDQYCPADAFARLAARLPRARAVSIEGADHFFFGKLFPLGEAVRSWATGWAGA